MNYAKRRTKALVALVLVVLFFFGLAGSAQVLIVDPDGSGPHTYPTIEAAVNASSQDDVIEITEDDYGEDSFVDNAPSGLVFKPAGERLTLHGLYFGPNYNKEIETPLTVRDLGFSEVGLRINRPSIGGSVKIKGNVFTDTSSSAIYTRNSYEDSPPAIIKGNRIKNVGLSAHGVPSAIHLENTSTTIKENTIEIVAGSGIQVQNTKRGSIIGNTIDDFGRRAGKAHTTPAGILVGGREPTLESNNTKLTEDTPILPRSVDHIDQNMIKKGSGRGIYVTSPYYGSPNLIGTVNDNVISGIEAVEGYWNNHAGQGIAIQVPNYYGPRPTLNGSGEEDPETITLVEQINNNQISEVDASGIKLASEFGGGPGPRFAKYSGGFTSTEPRITEVDPPSLRIGEISGNEIEGFGQAEDPRDIPAGISIQNPYYESLPLTVDHIDENKIKKGTGRGIYVNSPYYGSPNLIGTVNDNVISGIEAVEGYWNNHAGQGIAIQIRGESPRPTLNGSGEEDPETITLVEQINNNQISEVDASGIKLASEFGGGPGPRFAKYSGGFTSTEPRITEVDPPSLRIGEISGNEIEGFGRAEDPRDIPAGISIQNPYYESLPLTVDHIDENTIVDGTGNGIQLFSPTMDVGTISGNQIRDIKSPEEDTPNPFTGVGNGILILARDSTKIDEINQNVIEGAQGASIAVLPAIIHEGVRTAIIRDGVESVTIDETNKKFTYLQKVPEFPVNIGEIEGNRLVKKEKGSTPEEEILSSNILTMGSEIDSIHKNTLKKGGMGLIYSSVNSVTRNKVSDSGSYGIWLLDPDQETVNTKINLNSITKNDEGGLVVMTSEPESPDPEVSKSELEGTKETVSHEIDATLNYWGSRDGPHYQKTEGLKLGDVGEIIPGNIQAEYESDGQKILTDTSLPFSPWLGSAKDANPDKPGLQLDKLDVVVDHVGPEPDPTYLGRAIEGTNDFPGKDRITVRKGDYNTGDKAVKDPVEIISGKHSSGDTYLKDEVKLESSRIILGKREEYHGRGFTIEDEVIAGVGVDSSTIHINWNNIIKGKIKNKGKKILDGEYNWWGDLYPEDQIEGKVDYVPCLPDDVDSFLNYMKKKGMRDPREAIFSYSDEEIDSEALLEHELIRMGFSPQEARRLREDYGRYRLETALRQADEYSEFAGRLVGYQASHNSADNFTAAPKIAGGVGAYEKGRKIKLDFSLQGPNGGRVSNVLPTVSVLKGDQLVKVVPVEYREKKEAYQCTVKTENFSPGKYLIHLDYGDGSFREKTVKIT